MQLRTSRRPPKKYGEEDSDSDDDFDLPLPTSDSKMPPPIPFNPNLPPALLHTIELGTLRPPSTVNTTVSDGESAPASASTQEEQESQAREGNERAEGLLDGIPDSGHRFRSTNPMNNLSPAEVLGFIVVPADEREVQWRMLRNGLCYRIIHSMIESTIEAGMNNFSNVQILEACASILEIGPREIQEVKMWREKHQKNTKHEDFYLKQFNSELNHALLNIKERTFPVDIYKDIETRNLSRFWSGFMSRNFGNVHCVSENDFSQAQLFLGERGLEVGWAGHWNTPCSGRTLYSVSDAYSEGRDDRADKFFADAAGELLAAAVDSVALQEVSQPRSPTRQVPMGNSRARSSQPPIPFSQQLPIGNSRARPCQRPIPYSQQVMPTLPTINSVSGHVGGLEASNREDTSLPKLGIFQVPPWQNAQNHTAGSTALGQGGLDARYTTPQRPIGQVGIGSHFSGDTTIAKPSSAPVPRTPAKAENQIKARSLEQSLEKLYRAFGARNVPESPTQMGLPRLPEPRFGPTGNPRSSSPFDEPRSSPSKRILPKSCLVPQKRQRTPSPPRQVSGPITTTPTPTPKGVSNPIHITSVPRNILPLTPAPFLSPGNFLSAPPRRNPFNSTNNPKSKKLKRNGGKSGPEPPTYGGKSVPKPSSSGGKSLPNPSTSSGKALPKPSNYGGKS